MSAYNVPGVVWNAGGNIKTASKGSFFWGAQGLVYESHIKII